MARKPKKSGIGVSCKNNTSVHSYCLKLTQTCGKALPQICQDFTERAMRYLDPNTNPTSIINRCVLVLKKYLAATKDQIFLAPDVTQVSFSKKNSEMQKN